MNSNNYERDPILIVTCRAGSEDWCEEEIGNRIFHKDPSVLVLKTKYQGLLLVYSKLHPDTAYKYAKSYEYGFVEKIIPAHIIINGVEQFNFEDAKKIIAKLLAEKQLPTNVKLKVKIRGRRGLSQHIWRALIKAMKEHGIRHDPSSHVCIHVEGIDDMLIVGVCEC